MDRDDTLLFSESQSRFVVTIPPPAKEMFEALMEGAAFSHVGTVLSEGLLKIDGIRGTRIVEEAIGTLKAAWQKPLDF
jgi:phosphoribosylformylglycinamidine synthase